MCVTFLQAIDDPTELPKLEGQCWLALYNLLSKPQFASKYELTGHRREVLLGGLLPQLQGQLQFQMTHAQTLQAANEQLEAQLQQQLAAVAQQQQQQVAAAVPDPAVVEELNKLRAGNAEQAGEIAQLKTQLSSSKDGLEQELTGVKQKLAKVERENSQISGELNKTQKENKEQ